MKIFSMLFTVLFFFSFTSIASAETVYTITNKSDGEVLVGFDDTPDIPIKKLDESVDFFRLQPYECAKLTENQLYTVNLIYINATLGKYSTSLCRDSECKKPNHYEIINNNSSQYENDDYILIATYTANTSEDCKERKSKSWWSPF